MAVDHISEAFKADHRRDEVLHGKLCKAEKVGRVLGRRGGGGGWGSLPPLTNAMLEVT